VRAQAESPQGWKPLGTRRQKSDFRSSFCRLAFPRLVPADLQPKTDPERSEGHALIKIKNKIIFITLKDINQDVSEEELVYISNRFLGLR
jgi:hypothetical protein